MLKTIPRVGISLVILLTLSASAAFAGDNPYPKDWFWGNADQRAEHDAMIGKPAPDLDLNGWVNGEQTAKSLKNKIIVVDFWATWCGPCLASIPHNNEMAEKYADQGVVVLGVCGSSSGQNKMAAVAKDRGIKYSVGKDYTQKGADAWHVMWWPTYAVVDRDHKVRAVGLKPDHVEEVVDSILKEQPFDPDKQGNDAAKADPAAAGKATIDPDWLEGSAKQRKRFDSMVGNAPPALAVGNWLNSEPLELKDLKGKVVLIDCWATWCPPCIASIPHNNKLMEKYGKDGLVIIGVCATRGSNEMEKTAESQGIKYPIAADIKDQTVGAYKVNGFPDYYLIDRAGNLRLADCKNGSVEDAVKALLTEPAPEQTASAE